MTPYMIRVSGSGELSSHDKGQIWTRTQVRREGHLLHAITYIVMNGNPEIMRTTLDLRPILLAAKRLDERAPEIGKLKLSVKGGAAGLLNPLRKSDKSKQTGGTFGFITKSKLATKVNEDFSKILKSKGAAFVAPLVPGGSVALIKARAAQGAMQGKGTGGAAKGALRGAASGTTSYFEHPLVQTASFVFPPVSMAASAGIAAANKGLASIEAAGKLTRDLERAAKDSGIAKSLTKKLKRVALEKGEAAVKNAVKGNKAIRTTLKKGQDAQKALSKISMSKAEVQKILADADLARQKFKEIALAAKFETDPVARDHAKKLARLVRIAAEARAKVKGVAEKNSGGLPGLFIDSRGRLKRGRFARTLEKVPGAETGLLYQGPGENKAGQFEQLLTGQQLENIEEAKDLAKKVERARVKANENVKKSAAHFVKTKKLLSAAQKRDTEKARAAIAKSKASMKPEDQKRFAGILNAKLLAKKAARASAVKKSQENLQKSVKVARIAPAGLGKALATISAKKKASAYVKEKKNAAKAQKADVLKAKKALATFQGPPAQKAQLKGALNARLKAKASARTKEVNKKKSKAKAALAVRKKLSAALPGMKVSGCSCEAPIGYSLPVAPGGLIGSCVRVAGPMDRLGISERTQNKMLAASLRASL